MKVVKVSELKARLSRYLARVKAGEEVVVTERGEPIAKLVPLPAVAPIGAERIRQLERQGLARRGSGALPPDFLTKRLPKDPQGSVLAALLEERETGR